MANEIHSTALIGADVEIGHHNFIGPNVVLIGPISIGDGNWIGPGVVIGTPAEVRSQQHFSSNSKPERVSLITIGNNNIIREGVSIQRGAYRETSIGNDCFIMTRAYIAHDCSIGNQVTISANSSLAGHCIVQDRSNLGLASSFHQFGVIGIGAMVGMGSVVTKPVPPYAKTYGVPAKVHGANVRGMIANFDKNEVEKWNEVLLENHDLNSLSSHTLDFELKLWRDAIRKNLR